MFKIVIILYNKSKNEHTYLHSSTFITFLYLLYTSLRYDDLQYNNICNNIKCIINKMYIDLLS